MHGGDRPAVAGDADEAHQPLLARLDGGLERAARPHRRSQSSGCHSDVQLDQVDVVHLQPLERAMDLLARLARRSLRSSSPRKKSFR